jgi:tellurite resistance protein TehA-like permease
MTAIEILTLVPLGALVVAFGLFPGLVLDLFPLTVDATLESAAAGQPIAIPTEVVLLGLGLLAALIVGRIVYAAVVEEPAAERAPGAGSVS